MSLISIVVPCYNEAARLNKAAFLAFAAAQPDIIFCMANDGSKDATLQVLRALESESAGRIKVLHYEQNSGKAEVVRKAIMHIAATEKPEYIGFLDADLSAPPAEILPLLQEIRLKQLKIAAGARIKLVGKIIERKVFRHYFGRIFATYQDSLLQLGNYDTQCGLKIFDTEFAQLLFAERFTSPWFFDIEIFMRAKKILGAENYAKEIAEVPLNEWREIPGSKLKLTDFVKAPFEVLKIYRRYK